MNKNGKALSMMGGITGVIQKSCSVYNVHAEEKAWIRSDEGRH
ncbi:MAG: hypothetical protein ABR566_16595 [Pyrinomonadaceae bacterium]